MKPFKTQISALAALLLLAGGFSMLTGCKKPVTPETPTVGTIKGVVTDMGKTPVAEVTVNLGGKSAATTAVDGSYTITDVTMSATNNLSFEKKGYLSASVTVKESQFDASQIATVNISLEYAGAKITGKVTDGKNADAPMEGVKVSLTDTKYATTAADGTYSLEELSLDAYTVTFTKSEYTTVVKEIAKTDFKDGVVTLDVQMGASELLPGKTAEDLRAADKWLYNTYRGGRNGDDYPHWDWSCDFMCSQMSFVGWFEEQNEGTTLQIVNDEEVGQKNPANLDAFDSYTYGSKMITEDNKIMTLLVRTHAATDEAPAVFGVQVVDLSAADPKAVKIGDNLTLNSEDYKAFSFDLSAYVGKEVVIAVGIYRAATGDYWKQLVLRRIAFGTAIVENFDWVGGTEINDDLADWKLTKEIVRSTMVQNAHSFTGISPVTGDRDNYVEGYRSWREVNHIGYAWCFIPLHKDTEPFPGEGFIIKTNGGGTAIDTKTPQAYFYTKLAIASGSNKLTLNARTFSSTYPTYFKITVIDEDCNVKYIQPSNDDKVGESADDGCWKFCHESGDAGTPADYAAFQYDLAEFNGKNVIVSLGVFKGESNDDEQKLAIYSIVLE